MHVSDNEDLGGPPKHKVHNAIIMGFDKSSTTAMNTTTASSISLDKDNKREVFGWSMYDWANSAFSTTVVAVFLGPYLSGLADAVAKANATTTVLLFGIPLAPSSIFSYATSLSVLLQVFFLPLLGAIADYSNLRKRMMFIFATAGAIATIAFFGVTGGLWWLGALLYIIANLAFGASIVFYNSFLGDIASAGRRDFVSSHGFALGYLGGGILLLLNIILFFARGQLGIDASLATRINLASAGVWWLLFSQVTFQRLRNRAAARQLPPGSSYVRVGISQLRETFKEVRHYPHTIAYLLAYLVYNDGIQTVISQAAVFGSEELKLDLGVLSAVVLMIQFVAFGGSYLFDRIARRIGAKRAIMISLVVWAGLTIYAFGFLYTATQFFALGAILALVLGGSQALSRSLFSQMIPKGRESEFFSFYEISERGTSWMGPLVFGLVNQFTGSLRLAILSLIAFFIVGIVLLWRANTDRAIKEASA